MSRRGVTPVVAIILLLMMTVAAAGGAYAWMQQIQADAQAEAGGSLRTSIEAKDVICGGGHVRVSLKNGGSTDLEASDVRAYLYEGDALLNDTQRDLNGKAFTSPGGFDSVFLNFSAAQRSSTGYTIEMEFADASVTAECTTASQKSCRTLHAAGLDTSGIYRVDPDGSGGVAPFDVMCEMQENGGGWTKLSIGDVEGSACNGDTLQGSGGEADNAIYVDKQTSNAGWDGSFASFLDRDPSNFCLDAQIDTGAAGLDTNQFYRRDVDYVRGTDQSAQYSEAQENALRDTMTELSSTTRAFGHTYDDDHSNGGDCVNYNGEFRLYSEDGGSHYHYTGWQVDSGNYGWAFRNDARPDTDSQDQGYRGQYNTLPDRTYLFPAEFSGFNGCDSSGGSTSIAFGYEKNYFLIR